ncbi:protein-disulfide reductase DsbD family protein [Vitreimonas sp.]|uniref:protein-disulfide reductase DsbD family protein n=1 Tax=Vitreimonas sp. TaxID=3069702 RepID=UPI002D795DC0|nr:protein-disulfide reductase DsbD domain-containing protein [Vitreimonas sp.]
MLAPAAAQAPPLPGERQVDGSLHSARAAVAPGETFTIVLRQDIREHWHTYWVNPGSSGEPTELTWTAPAGASVGEIQWPAPKAIPFAMLVNFGYEGEVLFPIEITAPANAEPGQVLNFVADAYWLVCSDICIPEEARLQLSVPVAPEGRDDATWGPRVAAAVAALPRAQEGVQAHITAGSPARLSVALPNAADVRNARFFAFNRDVVAPAEPQRPRMGASGLSFDLAPGVANNLGQVPLEGVVAFDVQEGGAWVRRGVEITAEPGETLAGTNDEAALFTDDYALAELEGAARPGAAAGESMTAFALFAALGLALVGGLILNVMPCVLPVLSVKALSFAGGVQAGDARRHGLLYFAGVMATFLALAALLIALREAGEAVGWGFQLQAPWVTSALALLFFVIGLNLLGVFGFGGSLQNAGGNLTVRGGDAGAFFTGALAVIAATPCTAPFMAGAIGAALTQSAGVTLLIFAALGLGFALPLTLLHFAPGLQRLIPKPGPWMERVRNVLAFPMFAAAVWLVWVLAAQTGADGVAALLGVMAAIGFALFVARWGRGWMVAGAVAIALTVTFTWRPLVGAETRALLTSEPWSVARVEALRAEGRGVFVNFTAAWCVTCKVNEAAALTTPAVAQAFADHNVAYLVGDWTNRDEDIAAALADNGRAGVPLYLYFPPGGGEAVVLPQMLSQDLVIATVSGDTP